MLFTVVKSGDEPSTELRKLHAFGDAVNLLLMLENSQLLYFEAE